MQNISQSGFFSENFGICWCDLASFNSGTLSEINYLWWIVVSSCECFFLKADFNSVTCTIKDWFSYKTLNYKNKQLWTTMEQVVLTPPSIVLPKIHTPICDLIWIFNRTGRRSFINRIYWYIALTLLEQQCDCMSMFWATSYTVCMSFAACWWRLKGWLTHSVEVRVREHPSVPDCADVSQGVKNATGRNVT